MPGHDLVEKAAASLDTGEVLVCMDCVMFSGDHAFYRADKMSLCLLFRGPGGAWAGRILPWRSSGKPHRQVYSDTGMVRVDKDDPGRFHGRVLPESLASGMRTTPAAYLLRAGDMDRWPCTPPSQIVQDMRRMVMRFDGVVRPWAGLPRLLLSCPVGVASGLLDSSTLREYRGLPVTVHDRRAYYPFDKCFGRGVLAAVGDSDNQGCWMRVDLDELSAYGDGYSLSLHAVRELMEKN